MLFNHFLIPKLMNKWRYIYFGFKTVAFEQYHLSHCRLLCRSQTLKSLLIDSKRIEPIRYFKRLLHNRLETGGKVIQYYNSETWLFLCLSNEIVYLTVRASVIEWPFAH